MDKDDMCICGHPRKKHRKSGKCVKCGCKEFTQAPHPNTCRCEVCLWRTVHRLERQLNDLNKRMGRYLMGLFNISPDEVDRIMAEREKKEGK